MDTVNSSECSFGGFLALRLIQVLLICYCAKCEPAAKFHCEFMSCFTSLHPSNTEIYNAVIKLISDVIGSCSILSSIFY